MRILCIEDQKEKYEKVHEIIQESASKVKWAHDCQTGLMELRQNKYDLLLLDMSMPMCEEEQEDTFDSYAGMAVLREIKRKKYDIKVVIITGFSDFEKEKEVITLSELDEKIKAKYSSIYLGYVKYNSTSIEWQDKIKEFIERRG